MYSLVSYYFTTNIADHLTTMAAFVPQVQALNKLGFVHFETPNQVSIFIFVLYKSTYIVFGRKFSAQLPFFNYVVSNMRFHK